MVFYTHRVFDIAPRGTFSSCARRSTRPWFRVRAAARRYGCLENGLPWLLDATRLQLLAAAALKNRVGDAVEQRSRLKQGPGAAFFGCPGASKSALRRCGAGSFTDRVQASSGALGMLVCGWSVSLVLALQGTSKSLRQSWLWQLCCRLCELVRCIRQYLV